MNPFGQYDEIGYAERRIDLPVIQRSSHMRLNRRSYEVDQLIVRATIDGIADADIVEQDSDIARVGGDDYRCEPLHVQVVQAPEVTNVRLKKDCMKIARDRGDFRPGRDGQSQPRGEHAPGLAIVKEGILADQRDV